MQIKRFLSRRIYAAGAVLAFAVLVGWLFAYQPVTRNLIARDGLCTYCHIAQEYIPTMLTSVPKPHPRAPDGIEHARCVDCHLPKGFWQTTYAYTHFVSITDLFGHFRDRDTERAAEWIPPRAATAHRVRMRLYEYDSTTCRGCHTQSEIKPHSVRGQLAHRQAGERGQTCIECHFNMAHRQVELRIGTFKQSQPGEPVDDFETVAPDFGITPVSIDYPAK